MITPNAREASLAHQVDAAYVKATEAADTIELAGERCREVLARALAAYRVELIGENKPDVEVRYQGGELDEVIARQVDFFHLEHMDSNRVWMAMGWGDQRVSINLGAKGKIRGMVESDGVPGVVMRLVKACEVSDG